MTNITEKAVYPTTKRGRGRDKQRRKCEPKREPRSQRFRSLDGLKEATIRECREELLNQYCAKGKTLPEATKILEGNITYFRSLFARYDNTNRRAEAMAVLETSLKTIVSIADENTDLHSEVGQFADRLSKLVAPALLHDMNGRGFGNKIPVTALRFVAEFAGKVGWTMHEAACLCILGGHWPQPTTRLWREFTPGEVVQTVRAGLAFHKEVQWLNNIEKSAKVTGKVARCQTLPDRKVERV